MEPALPKSDDELIEYNKEYARNVIYLNRCAHCSRPSRVVHEIEPKSLRPNDWYVVDNLIVLCPICHEWAHHYGTQRAAEYLRADRERVLRERCMI